MSFVHVLMHTKSEGILGLGIKKKKSSPLGQSCMIKK